MSYGLVYDGPPTKCAKGPRPGTKALRDGVMRLFGCGDQGIFNCRSVRVAGDDTLSFHADGRAWDAECSGDLNRRIAEWLVAHADDLGVQEVIGHPRRRWAANTKQWRHYGGDDPHSAHVHVAQCRRAADTLTLATVLAIGGGEGPTPNQEDDPMRILVPTSGPDKDNAYLVGAHRTHIPTTRQLSELEAIYGPAAKVSDVTWDVVKAAAPLRNSDR